MKTALPLLLLLLALAANAGDADIAALIENGDLTVNSAISPESGAVPGQRMSLVIEVATDSWFTGGTRISIPEVPGLVILQTRQFAANATERRGGATWVVQRWTLDVYPQRAGDFTVGPIPLHLSVGSGVGSVAGTTASPPVTFAIALPAALREAEFWVAAPRFRVTQEFNRELDGLAPGDAFERTIVFEGTDTMAMMLPPFTAQDQPGLASYPAPPVLDNHNNRGEVRARRVQVINYLVEAPGSYRLPARDFFWWDTGRAELSLVSLPALEFQVVGAAPPGTRTRGEVLRVVLPGAGLVALLGLVGWILLHYRPWHRLAPLADPARRLWLVLRELRRPALPDRLNPGSSAGE